MALGTGHRPARNLLDPVVPRWPAPLAKVAPGGLAVGGGDRPCERRCRPLPRTAAGSRRDPKPVRTLRVPRGGVRDVQRPLAVTLMHPGLGSQPDRALPAFR